MASYRVLHNYHGHDKLYVARIDQVGDHFEVVGCWGKATSTHLNSQSKGSFSTLGGAEWCMNDLARDKEAGGYTDLRDDDYAGGFTLQQVLAKIDTSRLADGMSAKPQTARPIPAAKPAHVKTRKTAAARTITI